MNDLQKMKQSCDVFAKDLKTGNVEWKQNTAYWNYEFNAPLPIGVLRFWFFEDCSEPLDSVNDAITLEFSKENIRLEVNDSECIILTITNANCELYKLIKSLYKK